MNTRLISRRQMLRSCLAATVGSILAACSQPAPTTSLPTGEPAEAVQPTVVPKAPAPTVAEEQAIIYWTWSESNRPHFEAQIKRWNEEKGVPRLKLDFVMVAGSEESIQKGMNAMAAGSGVPDILTIETTFFSRFLKGDPPICEKYLTDITPKLDLFNPNWREEYVGFAPYTWQGKTYGVEVGLCPTGYYYRKDIFDEVGISMPLETWEDFMAAGLKMKEAGHAMFAIDMLYPWGAFLMDLYQAGGALFNEAGELTIESEQAYKALELNIVGVQQGIRWPAEAYWGAPHYAALNDGSVVGVLSAIWYGPHVLKPNVAEEHRGKWRVQHAPAWKTTPPWGGPGFSTAKSSTLGGTCLAVPKQGDHPDLTFDWLAFAFLTREGAASVFQNMGQMPMLRSVIHDDSVTNVPDEFYGGQAVNKVFADIADDIPPRYPHPFWSEATTELGNALAPAFIEGETQDYQGLIAEAARRIRDVIAAA